MSKFKFAIEDITAAPVTDLVPTDVIDTEESGVIDLGDIRDDVSIAFERFNAALEDYEEGLTAEEEVIEVIGSAQSAFDNAGDSPESQANAVAQAQAILKEDEEFNSSGFATESYTDFTIAREAFAAEAANKIVQAKKSNAGLLKRVADRLSEVFGLTSRFKTRLARARKTISEIKEKHGNKEITFQIKGRGFFTVKSGMIGGKNFTKKMSDNIDMMNKTTDTLLDSGLKMIRSEAGLIKLFNDKEAYRKVFFENYDTFLNEFMDHLAKDIKANRQSKVAGSVVLISDDILGGYEIHLAFPPESELPKSGDYSPEALSKAKDGLKNYRLYVGKELDGFSSKDTAEFTIKASDLSNYISDAGEIISFIDQSRNSLKGIQYLASLESQNFVSGRYAGLIESAIRYFVATLRLRRHAAVMTYRASSILLQAQFDMAIAAVQLAERAGNPDYWKD